MGFLYMVSILFYGQYRGCLECVEKVIPLFVGNHEKNIIEAVFPQMIGGIVAVTAFTAIYNDLSSGGPLIDNGLNVFIPQIFIE